MFKGMLSKWKKHNASDHHQRLTAEHLHLHYQQLPPVIIAPAVGALFTSWVLWEVVNQSYLVTGLIIVLGISLIRVILFKAYFMADVKHANLKQWKAYAIGAAFASGCVWGSAAIFLYPPFEPEYKTFMLVLLTLLPIVPVASLAVYMPSFYAYYIPCVTPFIAVLAMGDNRAEHATAVLLLMLMAATLTFANKYSAILSDAFKLRFNLAGKKHSLEKLAVEKNKFLATASHDLRQPVHALGLFVESFLQQKHKPQNSRLLHNIAAAIKNLRIMLNGMLDISRLDAHLVEVNLRDFDLNDLFEMLANEYQPLAAQKGIRFTLAPTSTQIHSDPILLERMLRNLLSNAIKFTDSGRVLMGVRRHGHNLRIGVYDTGTGIPQHNLDEIFDEYIQLHPRERGSKHGLGLGLSIVRRLGELLGHEVVVHSVPGQGSSFFIEVPKAPTGESQQAASAPDRSDTGLPLDGKLVVVIDDEQSIREAMTQLITGAGGQAIVTAKSEAALLQIAEHERTPDLLILDYYLAAEATAMDALKLITDRINHSVPTIIVTCDTSKELIREVHQQGHMLLHKPVDPGKLKACMRSQLMD